MHPRRVGRIFVFDSTDGDRALVGRGLQIEGVGSWVRAVGSSRHLASCTKGNAEGGKVDLRRRLVLDHDPDELPVLSFDRHSLGSRDGCEMQIHEDGLGLMIAEHGWAEQRDGFQNSDGSVEERFRVC